MVVVRSCRTYLQEMQQSDLSELRTFAALADAGSFAAAARVLERDPTLLSRRVASLETRLGIRLVERSTRRVVLTEAGREYLARILPLLAGLDAADREVSSLADGDPRGHLKVALPGTFARMWLGGLIVQFAKAHPRITLEADYSNKFVDLIGERFDLAVRLAELPDSRLIARKVADRRRLLCASPDYLARRTPIQVPEDVTGHDCLIFTGRTEPYRWQFQVPGNQTVSIMVEGRMASDDADLLVEAAIAGVGLMYTTDWHVGPALASGALVEVLTDWPIVDAGAIYVVTPAAGGVPSKTRAFSDCIANGLAKPPWRS